MTGLLIFIGIIALIYVKWNQRTTRNKYWDNLEPWGKEVRKEYMSSVWKDKIDGGK